jgi:hypothetical protein
MKLLTLVEKIFTNNRLKWKPMNQFDNMPMGNEYLTAQY